MRLRFEDTMNQPISDVTRESYPLYPAKIAKRVMASSLSKKQYYRLSV